MKTILIILSCIILTTSCSEDDIPNSETDENGVIVSTSYIWKRSLHLSTPVSNSGIKAPIYYNNNFVSPITNGGNNRLLAMINSDNGDILWQWDDRYQPETEYTSISYFYQYNNLLTYQRGDRSYCINLDNGATQWKFRRDTSFDVRIYPSFDNNFFNLVDIIDDNGYKEQTATKVNINIGNLTTEVIRANYSGDYIAPTNLIGAITNIVKVPNNSNLYAITYAEPLPNWEVNSFLGLYNSDTKQWVYEHKLMASPTVNSSVYWPKIYNNKLYATVGKNLVCHDLDTGEQLWIKQFTQDFMFSGFIIEEDKIIASNEDETLYCLNPNNGSTIWTVEGSGSSSRLAYLNGIVYFSGGGDGKLHAVDISNGKKVWKLNASNIDGSIFASYNPVFVLPAEGNKPARVFAHTLGNVVCFEAYQ